MYYYVLLVCIIMHYNVLLHVLLYEMIHVIIHVLLHVNSSMLHTYFNETTQKHPNNFFRRDDSRSVYITIYIIINIFFNETCQV